MSSEQLQVVAGITSTAIFISSNLPMLYKAFHTREMGSYSFEQIGLSNVGNLLYWLYVAGLPVGPVWFLHGFFTVATALMLILYLRYEKGWGRHSSLIGAASTSDRVEARLTAAWGVQSTRSATTGFRRINVWRRLCLPCPI